ncbi:ATP-binding protein [Fretibacter rubidus]|uniref:sensor histidine kinase n=1 Tax=Fretibacter rubidus TaxID=570162 RepID=UPI00352B1880
MLIALKKLYRNTLFRLSLLGAILFVVALFIALGNVYFLTISSEIRRVDKTLEAEIAEFQTILEEGNILSLRQEVFLRSASGDGLYVLISKNPDGEDVATGNLTVRVVKKESSEESIFPEAATDSLTRTNFILVEPATDNRPERERRVRGLAGPLKLGDVNGALVMVARDVEPTMRTAERVKSAILTSSAIALFLGLLSSWYVSRRFTRRVEAFNRLATDVRAGHLDRRAPRNHSEDEMDLLAEHLNDMLDHIDRLMKAMRYAGDSIAHDLRSPLTRLRTRLESAAADMGDDKAGEVLFAAADDANQLLKTFDSVLRIARLEAGERRELLKEIDPKTVLDDIAELYEPACEDQDLVFNYNIEDGHHISADRGLISQAVSNLVENAIKYTPKGGAIHLSLTRNSDGRTVISVADTGPGIPEDARQRVKERFVRLDASRSLPGSGLGLALVDAIADLHRAKFALDGGSIARPDGEAATGLTASLSFPRVRAGQGKSAQGKSGQGKSNQGKSTPSKSGQGEAHAKQRA